MAERAGKVGLPAWNRVKRNTLASEAYMQARPLRARRGRRGGGASGAADNILRADLDGSISAGSVRDSATDPFDLYRINLSEADTFVLLDAPPDGAHRYIINPFDEEVYGIVAVAYLGTTGGGSDWYAVTGPSIEEWLRGQTNYSGEASQIFGHSGGNFTWRDTTECE